MLPDGWTEEEDDDWNITYKHTDGRKQEEHPGKPEGVIAIAAAIPAMGAMTSLDLSKNNLDAEGAKHIAEALKDHVSNT